MPEPTTRTAALRAALVEEATHARPARSSRRWRIAAIFAAVALASGATGALSAAAISESSPYPANVASSLAASVARPNSSAIGEPFYIRSNGTETIDVGVKPDNATGLAIRSSCTEPGSTDIELDGEWISSFSCDEGLGGSGGVERVEGTATHRLQFRASSGNGYEAWVVWVQEPPMPKASVQQVSEMADGVATRAEYLAAFYRYAGCLGAKGFDLIPFDPDALILNYALTEQTVSSGSDEFCYMSQFQQVNMAWQLQNQDSSESTQAMRDCLSAHGIAPATRTEDVVQQLVDAGCRR